ncbi:Galactosyl transferase GMA12/MNN10 family protein [Actinidia rufa]|uniref:Galactosyl transferase GMA12/MNN10 family protein n=1 Tax=Actinidia rufa TaxID=165716 RepID=A0A7J0GAF5_9ERIC|nr:Galactosyl transferase GMA12/MNN10 family protein [Actinidia rufa]
MGHDTGIQDATEVQQSTSHTAANGGRPIAERVLRVRQIHLTFNNIKITVLCGLVTILVLHGYIGLNLSTSNAVNSHLIEETNWILARSDPISTPMTRRTNRNPRSTLMSPILSVPKSPIGTKSWSGFGGWIVMHCLLIWFLNIPIPKYDAVQYGYSWVPGFVVVSQKSWIVLNTRSFLFRNCQWLAFEADDPSALIYLLISKKDQWMNKVFVENSYYLHGYWAGLVDRYEEMIEKYHPGLGRREVAIHYPFCELQALHRGLLSPKIKRIRKEMATPLGFVDQFDIRRPMHGTMDHGASIYHAKCLIICRY